MKHTTASNCITVVGVLALWLSSSAPISCIKCCHAFVPSSIRPREWALMVTERRHPPLDMSSTASDSSSRETANYVRPMTTKQKRAKQQKRSKKVHSSMLRMLDHELLSKEEEQELALQIRRANIVREAMDALLEEKQYTLQEEEREQRIIEEEEDDEEEDEDSVFYAKYYSNNKDFDDEYENENDVSHPLYVEERPEQVLRPTPEQTLIDPPTEIDNTLRELTDEDIVRTLQIPGGRKELQTILLQGFQARQTLIRQNIRLVVSIAKRFSQQSISKADSTPGSAGSGSGGSGKKSNLVNIYSGDWTRPSIEEAIQEGILGLARAVEKFDPDQGYRFATYATFWITNYVRRCFQRFTTGSLRVPPYYYDVRQKYKSITRRYYETLGELPSLDVIAADCGVPTTRLLNILRLTRPLVSIDAPMRSATQAGKAGASDDDSNLLLSYTLPCGEPSPEEQVERSLLRQSLENAMATELSPNERDVLRLRLGLDDGSPRTVREIVDLCGGSLSMTEVRSAEQRALRKLRSPYALHTYELMGYMDFAGIDSNIGTNNGGNGRSRKINGRSR